MRHLLIWYAVLFAICSLFSVVLCHATGCLEETGSAVGVGNHTMQIDINGQNLTEAESSMLLAYHGYNVTRAGLVGLNGSTWHVVRCGA